MSKLMRIMTDSPLGGNMYIENVSLLVVALLVSAAFGTVMMLVYWMCHDTLTYNQRFNVTLMMLTMASTILLALIQNNPAFSLGALGALSICRIRTNTRDPRDLGFVFWALAIGISSALGAFAIGLMGTVAMSAVMLIIGRPRQKKDVLTMVVRGEKEQIDRVQEVFNETPGSEIQSKSVFSDSFEVVYDLKVPKEEEEKLMILFNSMDGISGVNVLAPETKVA